MEWIYSDPELLQFLADKLNELAQNNPKYESPLESDDEYDDTRYILSPTRNYIVDTDNVDEDGNDSFVSTNSIIGSYFIHLFIHKRNEVVENIFG